jgi:ribonuclease HII
MREGLDLRVSMIPPSISDIYNINHLLDVTYQQMLNDFFRNVAPAKCRVVVDDYRNRVGDTLHRFRAIESRGAEVLAEHRADDRHIEVRVASVIAKRERERLLEAVNSKPEFHVDGLSVGSGSAANDQTMAWLEAWKTTGQPWPWFIKRSVQTICELDGASRPKKRSLP